jgi:HK97 family phage major capsid protein
MTSDRATLLHQAEQILKQTSFSREDSSRVESLLQLADRYSDKSDLRRAALQARNIELGRPVEIPEPTPEAEQEFRVYFARGTEGLSEIRAEEMRKLERRALGTTTTAGGYLVPESFSTRLESMLKKTDGLFEVATLFETSTGTATGYPVLEDTANSAAVVAENGASNAGPDLVFAVVSFGACPMWRSGIIRAPVELISDAAFDFAGLVADAAGVRFARGAGSAFVSTLLGAASSAGTTSGASAITSDEIFGLVDAVDEAYAQNGSFLMRQSSLTYLRKLKGSGGAYMFPSERRADGVPMLAGFPVYISPSMGAIATGEKAVSFGDHSRFVRRQVRNSLAVKVYVERYAEFGQQGYESFVRMDGGLLKSGSAVPVKYLLQA